MTKPDATGASFSAVADADLVLRARSGSSDAFGELWRRHHRSGLTVARNITSSLDADDLVQEAYTRIYQSIRKGGGPTGSFRAYLFTSIRNTAAGWGRARKESNIDDFEEVEDPHSSEQASEEALDRSLTHRAFRSLPTRWQEVLWYTEIEQMKPAEIAPLLGLKATAVAQLSFRAREGLREAWIQAHLQSVQDGSEHQWTIERLGAYARNGLGSRDRARLDGHLGECARCTIVAAEAHAVGSRLALVLLPLTLGAVGAAGYLTTLQGGGAPLTVALAAMPSTVTQGAVVAGAGAAGASGATGSGAAGAGAAGSGAAGASSASTVGATTTAAATATTAAATGIFSGVGGTIALVTAGVVLAGGVATAAILPGALANQRQPPSAAALPLTTPSDDIVAAPMLEAPLPPTLPSEPAAEIIVPLEPPASIRPVAPVTPPAEPAPAPAPPLKKPPVPPGEPTAPPGEPTVPPVEPTDPPLEPTDPPVEPADPPIEPEVPVLPAGAPVVESARVVSLSTRDVGIALRVSGEAGTHVDVLFVAASFAEPAGTSTRDVRASGVLDESGSLRFDLEVTYQEFLSGSLRMQYVAGETFGELGEPLSFFGRLSLPADPPLGPVEPAGTPPSGSLSG